MVCLIVSPGVIRQQLQLFHIFISPYPIIHLRGLFVGKPILSLTMWIRNGRTVR